MSKKHPLNFRSPGHVQERPPFPVVKNTILAYASSLKAAGLGGCLRLLEGSGESAPLALTTDQLIYLHICKWLVLRALRMDLNTHPVRTPGWVF